LRVLHEGEVDDYYGVLSSHPFTICAVSRAFGCGVERVDLPTIKAEAKMVTRSSPIRYVREASLHGSLLEPARGGAVSCSDTGFYVDHAEPLEALEALHMKGTSWPLGKLPEGHEYLLVGKVDRGVMRHRY
jgi:hypothetical protein